MTFCQVAGITFLLGKGSQDNKYIMIKKDFYFRWMKTNVYSLPLMVTCILSFPVFYSGKQTKTIFFFLTKLRDLNCNFIKVVNIYNCLESRYKGRYN